MKTDAGAQRFTTYDGTENNYVHPRVKVLQDNQAGVRYLVVCYCDGVSVTPLLRADGSLDLDPETGM